MPNLASIELQAQPAVAHGAEAARLKPMIPSLPATVTEPLRAIMRSFDFDVPAEAASLPVRFHISARARLRRSVGQPKSRIQNRK